MKIDPVKIGCWLLVLICSSALVEMLKLPSRMLVEKNPTATIWILSIFLAEIIGLFLYFAIHGIYYLHRYKIKKQEETQHLQEELKCQQLLDDMNRAKEREEELEIVRRKCALSEQSRS